MRIFLRHIKTVIEEIVKRFKSIKLPINKTFWETLPIVKYGFLYVVFETIFIISCVFFVMTFTILNPLF